ncbi:MAG: hypothetical protein WCJ09_14325 [Planctomycetota bacterium]
MAVNLVSEEDLRTLLRPYCADAGRFEAGVLARLHVASQRRVDDPLAGGSWLLRSAAAYLPLAVLSGCNATNVGPVGFVGKCLGLLAFPAISLFFLIGATTLTLLKIGSIRTTADETVGSPLPAQEAIHQWWRDNKWGALGVFVVSLGLALVGATWILFLAYIISFGILLFVLASLAKRGLGNRYIVGESCGMGLMFLGQLAAFPEIGSREIHFLDQSLIAAVFIGGAFLLLEIGRFHRPSKDLRKASLWPLTLVTGFIVLPLVGWMASSTIWPATQTRIRSYIEGFDHAPYQTVSWERWGIVADWAQRSQADLDLTRPRQLFAQEVAGSQNPFILGTGVRLGLLAKDQTSKLKDYHRQLRFLVDEPPVGLKPQIITSVEQSDWIIRLAVEQGDLTSREQDFLAQRLVATLEYYHSENSVVTLKELLCTTKLLDVVKHPMDCDPFRERVHQLLKRLHTTDGGGFQFAGGFKTYLNWDGGAWLPQPGSLESTAYAIELMEIYGVPEGIDWNWVRAFLRPSNYRLSDDKWVASTLLDRLNHVPGITRPTWIELMYYERTILAAILLVGLCLYATFIQQKGLTLGLQPEESVSK